MTFTAEELHYLRNYPRAKWEQIVTAARAECANYNDAVHERAVSIALAAGQLGKANGLSDDDERMLRAAGYDAAKLRATTVRR